MKTNYIIGIIFLIAFIADLFIPDNIPYYLDEIGLIVLAIISFLWKRKLKNNEQL